MRVYIIGAGPGDPKLVTLRAAELIAECPVVLYTGSLVPREVLRGARPEARVLDSSSMTLDEIMDIIAQAHRADEDVARVHTGDPLLFGSTAAQMRRMERLCTPYPIVPSLPPFSAPPPPIGPQPPPPPPSHPLTFT